MYSILNSQCDHDLRDCVDLEKHSEKEIIHFFLMRVTFLPEICFIYMLYFFFVFYLFKIF